MNDFEVYKETISRENAQTVINLTDYTDRDNFFLDFEFLSGVNETIWQKYNICERYKTRNRRDAENNPYPHNYDAFELLAEQLKPVWDKVNADRNVDLHIENCWGIDLVLYSPNTILTPHVDGFDTVLITCLESRNILTDEGNLLLWQQDESSLDKIITEFPDNTDYKHSLHLEQGDTLWMDDKDYYHALTPITQGVRVTAISRWGNQTPDRGFDY